jgi:hypothetical protein
MKTSKNQKELLLILLQNSIVRFIAGTISIAIILKISNSISWQYIALTIKAFGYGFYYYLSTPFVIYWLAYASATKLNRIRLSITIIVTAIYSYVLWDSYFFFKEALQLIFFSNDLSKW